MDRKKVQNHVGEVLLRKIKEYKTREAPVVLSLGKMVLKGLKNNTSRMMGDYHVRFCERPGLKCPGLLSIFFATFFYQKKKVGTRLAQPQQAESRKKGWKAEG